MADIGRTVGGGFGLIRRRPLSVALWGIVNVAATALLGVAQLRLLGGDPETIAARAATVGFDVQLFAVQSGFGLLGFLVTTILWAAAFRAVLRPDERGFASLRLGMDELRLMAVTILLYLLFVVCGFFAALGFGFLVSLLQLATGGNPQLAAALATLLVVALAAGIVFLLVRLSVVTPLVIERRRIGIDESWELTRGHFWSLLGAYILMALVFLALALLIAVPAAGLTFATLERGAGGAHWVLALDRMLAGDLPAVDTAMLTGLALNAVMGALTVALWGGMLATAVLELLKAQGRPRESLA